MKKNSLCIAFRMTTKRKHDEVTLKTKYEALEEFEKKKDLTKKIPFSLTFLEVHFLLGTNQSRPFSVAWIVSEFSEQPTEVITGGDDENEDEEYNVQIAHP